MLKITKLLLCVFEFNKKIFTKAALHCCSQQTDVSILTKYQFKNILLCEQKNK